MDIIEVLLKDHASLRRRMAALEKSLGQEPEAGRKGKAEFEVGGFCRVAKELLDELLAHELRVLRAAAECCGERNVHAVRVVAVELSQALESHLAYEERSVFPLVRRSRARG